MFKEKLLTIAIEQIALYSEGAENFPAEEQTAVLKRIYALCEFLLEYMEGVESKPKNLLELQADPKLKKILDDLEKITKDMDDE